MRRITFFKTLLVAIALVVGSISASAQLLVEDFNYTIGTALTANGWTAHNAGGTNPITVISPTIYSTGYASSGVGNEVSLLSSGEDINRTFTATTSGTIYAAFLVKVTNAGTTPDYFFHLGPNTIGTAFRGRVWVKKDASNNLAFGIAHTTSTAASVAFTSFSYSLNSTYLIVLRYTIVSGTANDLSAIYINPTVGDIEPSSGWLSSTDTPTDPTDIGSVALRQGTAGNNVNVNIDGIRIATDWATAVAATSGPTPVNAPIFSVTAGNFISTQSVSLSSTTSDASIYYNLNSATDPDDVGNGTLYTGTPISVSSTTTIKAIAYKTGLVTSSIAAATYTFPTEVANVAALRAASTSGFYKLTGETFLTFQSVAGKAKYIQDATAGIVIYDGSTKITTPYNVGDGIKNIYCTLSMYNGTLELVPFNDPGAANSTGNTVTPTVVTLANLANYQGQLVKVNNVAITGTGNFSAAAATSYTITDASGSSKLKAAYTDLDYIVTPTAIPATNQDITGVVYNYSLTEVDLIPRTAADMINSQTFTSTATGGLWSSTGTWAGGVVPVAANDVVIADGATVTIDGTYTVASITVGQGTSGTLLYDRTTGRVLTVTGNVTVNTGGSFLSTDFTALTPTGDLTLLSTTIANVSSTAGIVVGMTIGGNAFNFPASTTVTGTTANTITVSAAPTVAGTAVPLTIQLFPVITQTLNIGGNLINNGTFDMSKGVSTVNASTTVCNVTFNNTTGDQTISGTTPVLTRFQSVTLAKSVVGNKVKSTIDTYIGGSNLFVLTAGTWNQNAGNLINASGNKTLGVATGKLLIDGSGGYTNFCGASYQIPQYTSASLAVTLGTLEVNTTGKVQIGAGNNSITNTGGTINFLGGNIYVYGRIQLTAGNNTFSGANIYIDPNPSASSGTYMSSALLTSAAALGATSSAFEVSGTMTTGTASFNFSSGSVTLVNPNAAATTGRDLKITATGTGVSIKGGTIYIGDGTSTRASSTYTGFVNGSSTILWNNVIVQTGNTIGRNFSLLGTNLNFDGTGTLTISANGVLDCQAKAVLGTANTTFNLLSGATIKTSMATGINGVLATWTGTANLSTGANYEFDGPTASAVTGTLIPATVNSLIVTNATGVTLSQATTVAGALTLTSGTVTLGANNLTVGSISGASVTKYVVTNGIGTLTQPVAAAGTVVFPIGASASSYDPVSVTPVSATNFTAKVSSTLSGTAASGYTYNAREWNLGSSTASSTALILTPSAVTASGINSIIGLYDGTNYVNVPATLASGSYSATVTSFPLVAVTGATDLGTGISSTKLAGVTFDGQTIQNNANLDLQVYDVTGRKVVSSNKNINMNSNPNGIYIVKSQNGTLKITVTK